MDLRLIAPPSDREIHPVATWFTLRCFGFVLQETLPEAIILFLFLYIFFIPITASGVLSFYRKDRKVQELPLNPTQDWTWKKDTELQKHSTSGIILLEKNPSSWLGIKPRRQRHCHRAKRSDHRTIKKDNIAPISVRIFSLFFYTTFNILDKLST